MTYTWSKTLISLFTHALFRAVSLIWHFKVQRMLFFRSVQLWTIWRTFQIRPRSLWTSHSTHRLLMHMVFQLCAGFLQAMSLVKGRAYMRMSPIHLVNSTSARHAKSNKLDCLSFIVSMDCSRLSPPMESTLSGSSEYRSKVYQKTLLIRKPNFIWQLLQYWKSPR